MKLNIVEDILTKNDCYKVGKTISPIGLQLHTIGTAQNTSKALRDYWNQSGVEACVHYCVDAESEGLIRHFLPDNRRSWGDGGFGNANLITVELMESDYMKYTGGANYTVTNESKFKADVTRAYNTAVYFFAYKCKQYGWNPLEKMSNGLYRISSHDEGRRLGLSTAHVDPTHIWNRYGWTMDQFRRDVKKVMDGGEISINTGTSFTKYYRVRKAWTDEKSQLGAYTVLENAKKNCPTGYYVFDESGKIVYPVNNSSTTPPTNITHGTQSSDITGTETEKAAKMLEMVHKCDKSGILYSVTAAQMILESGYCTTELSKLANNCFGMKVNLSGNTWESVWDGSSKVNIRTPEQDIYGNTYYINADFRKYKCIEDSIKDHSCYLLGAMNGSKKRYEGLTKCKDYKSAIILIKNGKYASDVSYVSKICNIIQRFGLDKYDKELTGNITETPSTTKTPYRVATAYSNGKYTNQVGAYDILDNAKKTADSTSVNKKKTYYVYDNTGAIVYTAAYTSTPSQSISTSKITKVSEWISTIKNWEQKMINVKAVYSNNGNKTDYTVALKQSPVTTNCALFVTHALQVAGIFDKKDKFYGSKGTSIKGSAASKMKEIGKVITYSKANMTTDKVDLRPGDILTYHEGHTNVYLGKDSNGKKQWSDAGRGTNIGCKEGSNWKSFRRTGEMSGYHVANIIRLNLTDDISTSTSKPSTSKKLYDVKVKIPDLRIRKTPNGEILKKNGKEVYTGIGIFGITEEVKSGGYTWGRLLSGLGWIALSSDYVQKM